MQTILFTLAVILMITANNVFGQKSVGNLCYKYKFKETEFRPVEKKDSIEIYFQNQFVGCIACTQFKNKGTTLGYENVLYDVNGNKVGLIIQEMGQFVIKYSNPYKVVYVKGLQSHNVIEHLVNKDKKLYPKTE